jgi:hypothetical protein
MSTRTRVALLAATVVIAIVAFIALKPDDKKKTTAATTDHSRPAPAIPQIVVKGAKPVGGITAITVSKGDPIRFTVKSDVSDEIHVHGYDLHKNVKAGGQVSFSFPAKIDGEFEVELESRAQQIAKLVVNP